MIRSLMTGMLVAIACLLPRDAPAAEPAPAKVLLLFPYDVVVPSTKIVSETLTRVLLEPGAPAIELYTEFTDQGRFGDEAHTENLLAYLSRKYAGIRFDIVVPIGRESLQFIGSYRDVLAPGAKVVAGLTTEATVAESPLPQGDLTAFVGTFDVPKLVELASSLNPKAQRIVVVTGAGPQDRYWADRSAEALAALENRFTIEWLSGLAMSEVLQRVAALPRDTIVVILTFGEDANGQRFVPRDAASSIARAASAPSYGVYETYLGYDVVGGFTESFEDAGIAVANVVQGLVTGKAEAPGIRRLPGRFRVDARQLERWGFRKEDLPPDTIVLFEEPSLWQEHGELITGILAVLAAQSLLLIALLIQRHRRQRAEEALRESEQRMTTSAEAANVGLWHIDWNDNRVWATDHCRSMFGFGKDDPLTLDDLLPRLHPDDRANVAASFDALRAGRPFDEEFRVNLPDGRARWLQGIGHFRSGDTPGAPMMNGIVKDVTAEKEAELQVEEHRRETAHMSRVLVLGELSGAIVHELNQPLAAIMANAQAAQIMLGRKNPDIGEALAALGEIVDDDRRAGQVIQRLRSMLKRDQGAWQSVDLNEIARSTYRLVRNELVRRGIAAKLELAENLPRIRGDMVQLQQVTLNLIMNAMDALMQRAADREIVVRTRVLDGGRVELTVGDNGHGVTAEQSSRIFQPFYTTKEQGLGLGLTICQSIVKSHGGHLALAAREEGGALATVLLPAQDALEAAA